MQPELFDFLPEENNTEKEFIGKGKIDLTNPIKVICGKKEDLPPLSEWAFLYTSTEKGNNSGIHFMMTKADAIKWCLSPVSKGCLYDTYWAYFWTTVENFAFCHWGGNHSTNPQSGVVDLRKMHDNGRWDEQIKKLGLTKFDKAAIYHILPKYGIEVRA